MKRLARVSLAAMALLATTVIAACGGGIDSAAVRGGGGGGMDALAQGVLGGDPNTGCLWIEDESGFSVQVLLAQSNVHIAVDGEDVVVLRGESEVLARSGERVELGGGLAPDQGVPHCPVQPTEDGSVFIGSILD